MQPRTLRLEHAVWDKHEWRAALWPATSAPRTLQNRAEQIFRAPVWPLNSARGALTLALRILSRRSPGKSEVLLPAYLCPALIDAVREARLQPRFAPVGEDLNLDPDAAARLIERHAAQLLAVVVAHMYACPARLDRIEPVARAHGLWVIDDAAHSAALPVGGPLPGSGGHIGLMSFAQSKTLTTGVRGSGALLIVNDPALIEPLSRACAGLPRAPKRRRAWLHFVSHYLYPRWAPAGYYLDRLLPADTPYAIARIAPLDAAIALAQWQKREHITAQRLRVLSLYHAALSHAAPQLAPGRYLSRLLIRTRLPDLHARLAARGIYTRPGYSDVAGRLLELPLGVTMCAADVERVCQSLRELEPSPPQCATSPC